MQTRWHFESDYTEGAFPKVMDALVQTNFKQTAGYGEDPETLAAKVCLADLCGTPPEAVHFVVGGTQANILAVAACLRPYQGVLAADSGHIAVHETGAIEAGGHKVLTLPARNGRLSAASIADAVQSHLLDGAREHSVQPGMVYISQASELGSCYSKTEMEAIYDVCKRYGLLLYIDGARLLYTLGRKNNDLDFRDYARCSDMFTLGGTKAGLLFGEAMILVNPALRRDFRYLVKQKGALLAKGRLLGVQFRTLMAETDYLTAMRRAVDGADRIRRALRSAGVESLYETDCNQVFAVLPKALDAALAERFVLDDGGPCSYLCHGREEPGRLRRFCTSWATREEALAELEASLTRAGQAASG